MGRKAKAKSWKAVTLDWTALQDYDHLEQLSICLTQRQVAILKALLTPAYWSTRWTALTATQDELEDFVSQIDYKLDGNDCEFTDMRFRDNPNDGCEVQYSTDAGIIWQTMFRKDNCGPKPLVIDIDINYANQTQMNTYNTTYAGDIVNVAPQWDYTDPDQDNALCWAIQQYVDLVCDVAIQTIESGNQDKRDANDWIKDWGEIAAGYVIAWATLLSAGTVTFPALALGALTWACTALLEAALDYFILDDIDAYQDEDAKDIIKCYMYQQIQGATPQFVPWQDSLSSWESFGGNEKVIAGAVNIANQSEDVYIDWLVLTEEINEIAASLPECPCLDVWSHTWDFANYGKDTWYVDKLGTPEAMGYWSPGVGFVAEDLPGDDGKNTLNFAVFPEAIPHVRTMTCTYDCVKGHWDNNTTAVELTMNGVGTQQWSQAFISTEEGQQKELIAAVNDATQAHVFLRSSYDETIPHDLGSMILTHVEFEGDGVDPFSGRITSQFFHLVHQINALYSPTRSSVLQTFCSLS